MHRCGNGRLRRLGVFAGLTVVAALAVVSATSASVDVGNSGSSVVFRATDDAGKVFVCKYVGTPGVNERLQTGDNPIDVSRQRDPGRSGVVGAYFADAQGRSFVLGLEHEANRAPGRAERLRVSAAGRAADRRLPEHRRQPGTDPRRDDQGPAGELCSLSSR